LVAKLKAWWLRWLGHVLRMPETNLLWRAMLWHGTTGLPEGTIFDDAPEYASLDELVELADNHDTKLGKRRCAKWGAMVVALQWGGGVGTANMKVNTPEETEVALEELGSDCIRIYTDGGGPDEHDDTVGWGAHVVRVHADSHAEALAQLWGPMVADPTSVWSIGCTRPASNTAEVTRMADGLELIDQRPAGNTYVILFDSMHVANVVEGIWIARTNVDAAGKRWRCWRGHGDATMSAPSKSRGGDAVAAARVATTMGDTADVAEGVMVEPPSERALRLTWRAWRGALPKMLCVMV
jgi:ribonuclease HI